mmetsp:Transcript_4245/g.9644  ORF Transcript_4245/g.9644 Transcript_4245/m.9644 type:complete len:86 (+) Transcript_4245:2215-2472(+)
MTMVIVMGTSINSPINSPTYLPTTVSLLPPIILDTNYFSPSTHFDPINYTTSSDTSNGTFFSMPTDVTILLPRTGKVPTLNNNNK